MNRRTHPAAALALAALALAAGCSALPTADVAGPAAAPSLAPAEPAPAPARRGSYLGNRGRDAADILGLRVSFGKGLVFNPQVTKYLMVGFENYEVKKFGFYGRHYGVWKERNLGGGILWYYDNYGFKRWPVSGNMPVVEEPDHDNIRGFKSYRGERDIGDIGVTVHCVIGFGFEIRGFELLDFFTGIVGVDIAGDDR